MGKLRAYAQEVLNLYNYFNGAIIFDRDAIAVYYYNNRPDINQLTEQDVVGRHLRQIYPELDMTASTVMEALEKGVPTSNMLQKIRDFKGQELSQLNTTIPIFEGDSVIGAAEVSTYVDNDKPYRNIFITSSAAAKQRSLYTTDDIVSCSGEMERIKEKIRKVARTDSSVLIYGRTGTGKEMVAEAIHTSGNRSGSPFVSQNCAAIPSALLESILFGSIKGAFTGAEDRPGLLETADGGTVFLDEIGSMEFRLQAKLLRAIEEQRVMRVGGHDFRPVNVRVLAALNEEPLELVRTGILREDLYYRLRVIQIDLPQLRERREDIRSLTAHFIEKFNREMNKSILDVDRETATFFQSYSWPGNVRELANAIEGAFNFAEGQFIHMDDIGLPRKHSGEDFFGLHAESGMTLKELVRRYERLLIEESLTRCRSTAEVAEDLGITRQNLNHKLKNYNLDKYFDVDKKI